MEPSRTPFGTRRELDKVTVGAEAAFFVMQVMVNGVCESPYTAALREAKKSFPGSDIVEDERADETLLEGRDDWDLEDSDELWEDDPNWRSRPGLWLVHVFWPGGQFHWSPTPWDREGRERQILTHPESDSCTG